MAYLEFYKCHKFTIMKKNTLIKGYFLTSSSISTMMGVFLKLEYMKGYNFAFIVGFVHFIGFVYFFMRKETVKKVLN